MSKKRAAIYARYSSELQSPRSIEDQIALCRAHAQRIGVPVVAEFSDRAKSGSNIINREGMLDLLHAAKAGQFEIIIVEALDRLSRDQEDLAGLYKRLTFAGITIEAVNEGRADQIQIGVRGMLGSLYLTDLAHKVRRGMQGVVRDGRSPGGRAYGYTPRKGEPGVLDINEAEAQIVRRIFNEYNLGKTPRMIARDLNRDGVPPPRSGGTWNASTINGNMKRACGIIQNSLYNGELIYNRIRMIRDPDTGKRVSRPNPEEQWQVAKRPELAIVSPEVFAAAQARKADNHKQWQSADHKPRRFHMFSGLFRCGVCGSGMSLDGHKDGHRMIRCSRARESSSCTNSKRARLDKIERTVIRSLKQELSQPGVLQEFVNEYTAELRRLATEVVKTRSRIEKELGEVKAGIARLVDAMASGLMERADVASRYEELKARKARLEGELALADEGVPDLNVAPMALARYGEIVEKLAGSLETAAEEDDETRAAIRELIDSIRVFTEPELAIQVLGKMAALTGQPFPPNGGIEAVAGERVHGNPPSPEAGGIEVVAGEGVEPPTPGL